MAGPPEQPGRTGPRAGSPTIRRREFGSLIRGLRVQRGWTMEYVAELLLCSPSKVSRLESGQRGASARDVRDLCNIYEVSDEQRARLADLASAGKQRAWWQPLGLPYSTYVGLEAEASSIRDYGLGIIPGLLQTADYARAVVEAAVPRWVPEVVEQRVQGRMARQQILEPPRRLYFDAVMDESVLHRVVGGPQTMAAQLARLLEVAELPEVSIRVIPYDAGALPAGNNKFILLSFAASAVPDVVFIEGLTGDLYLEDVSDVEVYNATFRALSELALSPEQTRGRITSVLTSYRR